MIENETLEELEDDEFMEKYEALSTEMAKWQAEYNAREKRLRFADEPSTIALALLTKLNEAVYFNDKAAAEELRADFTARFQCMDTFEKVLESVEQILPV